LCRDLMTDIIGEKNAIYAPYFSPLCIGVPESPGLNDNSNFRIV